MSSEPLRDSSVLKEDLTPRVIFDSRPWRRFVIFERDSLVNEFEGRGIGLDDVTKYLVGHFNDAVGMETAEGYHARRSAGEIGDGYGDLVVYEGSRLWAVFRPLPDGRAEVIRFDRPAPESQPARPEWLRSIEILALSLGEVETLRRMSQKTAPL